MDTLLPSALNATSGMQGQMLIGPFGKFISSITYEWSRRFSILSWLLCMYILSDILAQTQRLLHFLSKFIASKSHKLLQYLLLLILMLWHRQATFGIERRQVISFCWIQDTHPGSQTQNCQQTECPLTNRLSYQGYFHNWSTFLEFGFLNDMGPVHNRFSVTCGM